MKELTLSDLKLALDSCARLTGDLEFVVVGSVSILGARPMMAGVLTVSADIDLFPRFNENGEKNELIERQFGAGSQFELENNFYIEGVGSWTMMTSPKGWDKRMIPIITSGGVTGWCLDPFDLAYNKLEAGRTKDIQYVAEMVRLEITPILVLEAYLRQYAPGEEVILKLVENLRQAEESVRTGDVSKLPPVAPRPQRFA